MNVQELGGTDAFNCSEMEMVSSEVKSVDQWRHDCESIAGLVGNAKPLPDALAEVYKTTITFCHHKVSEC